MEINTQDSYIGQSEWTGFEPGLDPVTVKQCECYVPSFIVLFVVTAWKAIKKIYCFRIYVYIIDFNMKLKQFNSSNSQHFRYARLVWY